MAGDRVRTWAAHRPSADWASEEHGWTSSPDGPVIDQCCVRARTASRVLSLRLSRVDRQPPMKLSS